MARFIETEDGFINLDCVVRIVRKKSAVQPEVLYLEDGHLKGTKWVCTKELLAEHLAEIIPAAPGAFVWFAMNNGDNDTRPTEVTLHKETVYGWYRISNNSVWPVVDRCVDWFLAHPDGRVEAVGHKWWENTDALKQELLLDAQEHWDRQQQAAA